MRKDLHMTKGKYVAQGSHASLGVVRSIDFSEDETKKDILAKWLKDSYVKVCVYVNSKEELHDIYNQAIQKDLPVRLITDNGLTMFDGVKTDTCLAILGYRTDVDEITGGLRLL